jgi:hypothetical protein
VGLEIGRLNHDGLGLDLLGGYALHHPGEYAHVAPSLPAVIQCLVRPVFPRRIPPAQAVPVDENDPAQNAPVIDLGLVVTLGEIGRRTYHLPVHQPIQTLMLGLLAEPESHRDRKGGFQMNFPDSRCSCPPPNLSKRPREVSNSKAKNEKFACCMSAIPPTP